MCWYPFCLRTQPAKTSKAIVFTTNVHVFTHQKNMICDDLRDLFRYLFWHWFLINLDIDFASILAPVWYQIPCLFGDRFIFFVACFFYRFGSQIWSRVWSWMLSFSSLFRPRSAGGVFEGSLAHCGSLSARFWLPFGSMLVILGTLFAQFWIFLVRFFSASSPKAAKHL